MKKSAKSNLFNFLLTLIICGLSVQLIAQNNYEKKVNDSFSGVSIAKISSRQGPLEILPSTDGKLTYDVTLTFQAKAKEDAETLKKNFSVSAQQVGSTIDIYVKMDIVQSSSKNGITKIKFKNGDRVKDIKDIKVSMKVYIPDLTELELSNKYDKIIMENAFNGKLAVNLYNGELRAPKATGDLDLEAKYSRIYLDVFKEAEIKLYDSKMHLGNGSKLELETKYSEIEMGNINSLKIDAYDDKFEIGTVGTELRLEDKYSEFQIEQLNNARIELYDSELEVKKAGDLQLKSKYTKFRLGDVASLDFDLSYDDIVDVEQLGSLSIYETKYTDYDIGSLTEMLDINSYDDNIRVGKVGPAFKSLEFDGKYTDLDLTLDSGLTFKLESDTKYGNFTFPQEKFTINTLREEGDEKMIKAALKNAGDSSPLFKIDAYDCKIRLRQ